MAHVDYSLDKPDITYTVFEKDQVLTEKQLNGVVSYLDAETRRSRVDLDGVGVAAGLRVSLSGSEVTLTRGVGVTTDGDLVSVLADTVYASYRERGPTDPVYDPLDKPKPAIKAWVLIKKGETAPTSFPLSEFASRAGSALGTMAVMLLVETFDKDQDQCSGTDCDNLGKKKQHEVTLLLVAPGVAASLLETWVTPDSASRQLDFLAADRPQLTGAASFSGVESAYKAKTKTTLDKLTTAFATLYAAVGPFVLDFFPTDPTGAWVTAMNAALAGHAGLGDGLVYVHDYLSDLVETYNALGDALAGDTTVCCPARDAFPKHLLLGMLGAPGTPIANDTHRTGFYPSPAVGAQPRRLDQARFCFVKLGALALGFSLPETTTPIRITPSMGEGRPLDERAIPYYYDPKGEVRARWSFALSSRGRADYNYGYSALDYGAKGPAAAPFKSSIGRFPFFRVEGHRGKTLKTAIADIEAQIKSQNLPIAVHAVLVDPDRKKIIPHKKPRYTHVHRMHRVMRYALADQLDEAASYADRFKLQVEVEAPAQAGNDPQIVAKNKRKDVQANAKLAADELRKGYDNVSDDGWRTPFKHTQEAAGQFKQGLSPIAKTEFTTPFDTIIGSHHGQVLGRLQDIIAAMEDKAAEHSVFGTFLEKHPGLEHRGGAPAGGTLVIAYHVAGYVLADFALPYRIDDDDDAEDETPPQTKPLTIWPDWVIDKAVSFLPPFDAALDKFWGQKHPEIEKELAAQRDIFLEIKDLIRPNYAIDPVPVDVAVERPNNVRDDYLGSYLDELNAHMKKLSQLEARLVDPGRSKADKKTDQVAFQRAEADLAASLAKTADLVKTAESLGLQSDAYKAMSLVAAGARLLKGAGPIQAMSEGLDAVGKEASPTVRIMLANIVEHVRAGGK